MVQAQIHVFPESPDMVLRSHALEDVDDVILSAFLASGTLRRKGAEEWLRGRMLEGEDQVGVRDQAKSESVRTKRPINDARFRETAAAVLAPSAT